MMLRFAFGSRHRVAPKLLLREHMAKTSFFAQNISTLCKHSPRGATPGTTLRSWGLCSAEESFRRVRAVRNPANQPIRRTNGDCNANKADHGGFLNNAFDCASAERVQVVDPAGASTCGAAHGPEPNASAACARCNDRCSGIDSGSCGGSAGCAVRGSGSGSRTIPSCCADACRTGCTAGHHGTCG